MLRGGVDTQVIVGTWGDTDLDHLKITEELYRLGLRRVYYSGFQPILGTPLETMSPAPRRRVYRLYQASFLLRDYGFTLEMLKDVLEDGMLPDLNPKLAYASRNPNRCPVDVEEASYKDLLLVPGIGPRSAREILEVRRVKGRVTPEDILRILGRRRGTTALRYLQVRGGAKLG